MGLEAFNFIPDLVATNPEPTDPVAQGDDHLRGIKFTLQNQWPLIGEDQVTRTALQMNDAALRSEDNTFSGANIFSADATFQAVTQFNSTGARARATNASDDTGYLFISDIATQRWNIIRENSAIGGNLIVNRFDANGTLQDTPLVLQSTNGQMRVPDGNSSAPGYSFQGQSDMGMFRSSAGILGLNAGTTNVEIGGSVFRFIGPDFSLIRMRDEGAGVDEKQVRLIYDDGIFSILTETDAGVGVQEAMSFTVTAGSVQTIAINGQTLDLNAGIIKMDNLPTGPTGISGQIYAKQSQTFAPTELVLGQTP